MRITNSGIEEEFTEETARKNLDKYRVLFKVNNCKIQRLQAENKAMREVLEMVQDNSKMPHKHTDPQLRLYCLAERASEALGKINQEDK